MGCRRVRGRDGTDVGPEPALPAEPGLRVVDNDVRFTVYRPQALAPGMWASLLVFAHKTDLVIEPGQPPVDPSKQVEAMARAHFGDAPVRSAGEDARSEVFRGARLRITVDLPGLRCNPDEAELDWWEPVHQVVFRLLAGPDLVGSVVRGAVRVWCGPLLLGEVSLAIGVTASASGPPAPSVTESAQRYRKIFPSYSHDDEAIVADFAKVVRALGDEYLQDVLTLRSGERWQTRLPELIEQADVFQLFWSSNSMRSPYCQQEWEHALALGRPLFVRPVYWEDPMPQDPTHGAAARCPQGTALHQVRRSSSPGGHASPARYPAPARRSSAPRRSGRRRPRVRPRPEQEERAPHGGSGRCRGGRLHRGLRRAHAPDPEARITDAALGDPDPDSGRHRRIRPDLQLPGCLPLSGCRQT